MDTENLNIHMLRDEQERIAVRLYTREKGEVWFVQGDTAIRVSPDILRKANALVNDS